MTSITQRLRLHPDNKTKAAMQIDCTQAADEIDSLNTQITILMGALTAMADDGWLYYGPEGMSDAQKLCSAALEKK